MLRPRVRRRLRTRPARCRVRRVRCRVAIVGFAVGFAAMFALMFAIESKEDYKSAQIFSIFNPRYY